MSANQRLIATVLGQVQGVCFRHYTRLRARELELHGWVKNQSDGSVLVFAEGPRESLDLLLQFLQHGPDHARVRFATREDLMVGRDKLARVDNVIVEWHAYQGDLSRFSVAH